MSKCKLLGSQLTLVLLMVCSSAAQDAAKKKVTSQADLPRFSYPLAAPASELVQADSATFDAFAMKVRADLDSVLLSYEISDKATMRTLLSTKADLQELAGDYQGALETVKAIRGMEDKPAARLTSGLFTESELKAAIENKSTSGTLYEQAFKKSYSDAVNKLPWDVVQDTMKAAWAGAKLRNKASLISFVKTEIDPAAEKSKAVGGEEAATLIFVRRAIQFDRL